jgi:hypothetical protein
LDRVGRISASHPPEWASALSEAPLFRIPGKFELQPLIFLFFEIKTHASACHFANAGKRFSDQFI